MRGPAAIRRGQRAVFAGPRAANQQCWRAMAWIQMAQASPGGAAGGSGADFRGARSAFTRPKA
jgi:hypothetical protein